MISNAGKSSRQLWQIVNEVVDRKQIHTFTINGRPVTEKKDIANAFNDYFASVGTDMANELTNLDGYEKYLNLELFHRFQIRLVEETEVEKLMKLQRPKLSCGLDTINNKVVKSCATELAKPMTHIINISIHTGCVPVAFKVARIIPLYKKNASDECGNYRPVSLLSALSKILEKVTCSQMMAFFKHANLVCHTQYGFRPKSQTIHVIQHFMNFMTANAALKKPVIATFIDLSKAFDCLQCDKLFKKMT